MSRVTLHTNYNFNNIKASNSIQIVRKCVNFRNELVFLVEMQIFKRSMDQNCRSIDKEHDCCVDSDMNMRPDCHTSLLLLLEQAESLANMCVAQPRGPRSPTLTCLTPSAACERPASAELALFFLPAAGPALPCQLHDRK